MTELQIHQAAEIMPLMDGDDFDRLAEDIQQNGLLEPIWLYEGQILDGRHRYRVCMDLGIDPEFRQYESNDPIGFVLSLNLSRRHLTTSQRAMIAARIANLPVGSNQHVGIPTPSQTEAAASLNVSRDSVIQAKKIIENESEETIQKVDKGELTVHAATKKPKLAVANEPEDDPEDEMIQQLSDEILSLDEENEQLRDAIATNQLPTDKEIRSAKEIIRELRAKIRTLEATLDAVKCSRDSYLRENEQLKNQCEMQRKQLKKMGAENA